MVKVGERVTVEKNLSQWFKITRYAEELLNDLNELERGQVKPCKKLIGQSIGEINFKING